jgi:hypothetical protein
VTWWSMVGTSCRRMTSMDRVCDWLDSAGDAVQRAT